MTDNELNDLEAYVAEHPDDPVQRWGLAKKLYLEGEFQRSVKHLSILKELWPDKVNVRRYLAANYYRLSRYDEAIDELRASSAQWGNDIPIREQLARVYEVAGRRSDAIAIWKEIQQIAPGHAMAVWALSRLQDGFSTDQDRVTPTTGGFNGAPPSGMVPLHDHSGGMFLPNATPCPECGTPNSDEFERCWRCRAPLHNDEKTTVPKSDQTEVEAFLDPEVHFPQEVIVAPRLSKWVFVVALLAFVIGCWVAKKSFDEWSIYAQFNTQNQPKPLTGLEVILWYHLFPLRMILGGVLFVCWPLSIWLSSLFVRGGGARLLEVMSFGLLFAFSAYLITWLPFCRLAYPVIVLLCTTSIGFVLMFRYELGTAMTAWIIHLFLVSGLVIVTAISVEGQDFVMDVPAMRAFEMKKGITRHVPIPSDADWVAFTFPAKLYTPLNYKIHWISSGSQWLDRRIGEVRFEIETKTPVSGLTVSLLESADSGNSNQLKTIPYSFDSWVEPEQPYTLEIKGEPNTELIIRLYSMLDVEF